MLRSMPRYVLFGLCAATGACRASHDADVSPSAPAPAPSASTPAATVQMLSPTDHLVRASMVLRGKRPSVADLQRVKVDPGAVSAIVDTYLASPEFGETMRELHNEALLVQVDTGSFPAGFPPVGALANETPSRINRSITEAPLRLIEHVIMNDRPYTEIVTADYTMADGIVSKVWEGLDYDGDGTEWKVTHWTGDRDNAGILSDDWLFSRNSSTASNADRGRANAISKALLCTDFLDREIKIDTSIDLGNPDVVANAVVANTACAGCHQTLDPLASYFSGYYPIFVPGATTSYPVPHYAKDAFPRILGVKMRPPSYFGQKLGSGGLRDLGALIAEDPRFTLCAAKHFYAYFNQVPLADVPFDDAASLAKTLEDNEMSAKALARAVVLSDTFRQSYADTDAEAETLVGLKKARPRELGRAIEDLTGFRWQTTLGGQGDVELMDDSFFGFKVLAGGIDAYYVTKTSPTYNATASLALRALAAAAAGYVVDADLADGAKTRTLLTRVGAADQDESAVRAELVDLWLRIFGEFVDANDAEITDGYALFRGAMQHANDVRRAWKVTLTALFQDPRVAYY